MKIFPFCVVFALKFPSVWALTPFPRKWKKTLCLIHFIKDLSQAIFSICDFIKLCARTHKKGQGESKFLGSVCFDTEKSNF